MTEGAVALPPDQLALVRRTIAQGATDDELALYLYDCQRHGVHPLDKLLHFTKRGNRYTPITSIDLMRTRAAETEECLGISDATFAGTVATANFTATVTVRRLVQGQHATFIATARWPEYYPGDGPMGGMWRRMPHTMLGKCAEALALRKGFPKQLAGLYAREELDQASRGEAPKAFALVAEEPAAAGVPQGERVPGSDDGDGQGGWAGDPDAWEELPSSEPDPAAPPPADCISSGQVKRLYAMLRDAAQRTGETAAALKERLRAKLQQELHIAHLEHISRKDYERACLWVEAQGRT